MAEDNLYKKSKFIDFQDKNGDGLNDQCDDLINVAEVPKCPECQPNPNYITPNWRNAIDPDAWFNEKFCKYQVVIPTSVSSILDGVDEFWESNKERAINTLLDDFGRVNDEETRALVEDALEYQKYDLSPRPGSYLKLLYSVSYDVIDNLPAAEDDEDSDEDDIEGPSIVVEMDANLIQSKMLKFRKAMNMYARFYRVMSAIDGGALVWQDGPQEGAVWSIDSFDRYGDSGLFPNSVMADVVRDLNSFLNNRGLNIFGVGPISFGRDRVTKLEFTWNSDYKLKKLRAYTVGCGEKPKVYKKRKLAGLNKKPAYKDAVAQAFFAQLDKIDTRLSARNAPIWTEFVQEFTIPQVAETFNWPGPPGPEIKSSCVGDALREQGKQLGADIMDEVFGIGDAIAFKFNLDICKTSLGETLDDNIKFGEVIDPNGGSPKNLLSMATDQAFRELDENDQIFANICAMMLMGASPVGLGASSISLLDEIYAEGLDRIKLCGLLNLCMDVAGCLMGGLSLEEALSRIIKSTLSAMSIDNLGDFFIGLPPEKQAELEALVEKKIQSGDIFKDASGPLSPSAETGPDGQTIASVDGLGATSDVVSRKVRWSRPWDNVNRNQTKSQENGRPATIMTQAEQQNTSQLSRRTLAQQFDIPSKKDELSPNVVLEAYIAALIETYQDDLLSVVDLLNKYPGAQLIAKLIATMDCPRPPIFDPNFMDFIKDIEIPWCRNTRGIVLPRLVNPFGWIPKLKDFTYLIWRAFLEAINRAIIAILFRLMVKLCELIGSAICKALEVAGSLVASLPAIATGRSTFAEVVNKAICGGDADEEQIKDTIAELFEKLGAGGAALADKDAVMDLAGDISAMSNRGEFFDMLNGNTSPELANGIFQIIQNEYPDKFGDAFSTPAAVGDLMAGIGALMPEDLKKTMRDLSANDPEGDRLPANPTLCATEEQLQDFEDLRCTLLEGRATPEQCRQMLDDMANEAGDDLEGIMSFMNDPMNPADLLPPLISSPGCSDGILPFESDEQQVAAKIALGSGLKALKREYIDDMLGNGGFLGFGTWGLINMIMADTMGNPLTVHQRKTFMQNRYVDFVTDATFPNTDEGIFGLFTDPAPTKRQIGNYPTTVAPWLQGQLSTLETNFNSSNVFRNKKSWKRKLKDLDIRGRNIDAIGMPDLGYGYTYSPANKGGDPAIKVTRAGRKKNADIVLGFTDNNKGRKEHDGTTYLYGFDLKLFLSELEEKSGVVSQMGTYDTPLDTMRVSITELYRPGAAGANADFKNLMSNDEWKDLKKELKDKGNSVVSDRLFEFLAIDDTFDDISVGNYPQFLNCFEEKSAETQQLVLLEEMLGKTNQTTPSTNQLKIFRDDVMSNLFSVIAGEVADNDNAFAYGAKYDDLTEEDAEYVVRAGQTDSPRGTLYEDAEIDGDSVKNEDMILGVSRDQLENGDDARIYYLDPKIYGGTYSNPAVYIKPLKNEGWLGFIDILFPDYSVCKPRNADLINFESIAETVSTTYNTIPEDDRLRSEPDCVVEMPYNRILERPSKASIQGYIQAACRIYGSTHFIKSMATFTTFKPDFKNVYSSVYAQYIVESMEKSLRDAKKAIWEFFSPFKDDEFWYAFLEQSVQTYSRLVDDGTIIDPPDTVVQAMIRINDAQENHKYPYERQYDNAKDADETDSRSLKRYREETTYEFVQATEEDAKIVLKEMVIMELEFIANALVSNMESIGMSAKYTDLSYYLMSNLSQGGSTLDLDKEIKEVASSLPTSGEEHYTGGGALSSPDGSEYVGYYHVHEDEDGNVIYMAGEFHTEDAHDELTPFANQVSVPIGNIDNLGEGTYNLNDKEKPFILEKYMSINGSKMSPTNAMTIIKQNDNNLNVSDVYPGGTLANGYLDKLELVYPRGEDGTMNTSKRPIGVRGDLGIKYGVQISVGINGRKYLIGDAEIGAIDTKIGQVAPFEGDSKLLLCLINKLKAENRFRLLSEYIFPLKKVVSMTAIYNDLGFFASIGELTVEDGDTKSNADSLWFQPNFVSKPGAKISFPDGPLAPPVYSGDNTWASHGDRNAGWSLFTTQWDEWDRVLLTNSKARLKKLFKQAYLSRDFNPVDADSASDDFAAILMNNMKSALKPQLGFRILPSSRKSRLISNPFNSKGGLCSRSN